jgi:hypothetical protein
VVSKLVESEAGRAWLETIKGVFARCPRNVVDELLGYFY